MKIAGMSALMVVALVASASAQEIEFDLFGIRIGDTFEKVETVLLNRGFRPPPATIFGTPPIRYGPTFEQAVALRRNEIEKQDATGAVAEANYLRGFDKVQVDFTPWPDGPAVTRVTYRPDIVIPDDCPGFREAFDARYSHGIAYKGKWLDRPTIKQGTLFESPATETVFISEDCVTGFFGASIDLYLGSPHIILNDLLDEADGEVVHDF